MAGKKPGSAGAAGADRGAAQASSWPFDPQTVDETFFGLVCQSGKNTVLRLSLLCDLNSHSFARQKALAASCENGKVPLGPKMLGRTETGASTLNHLLVGNLSHVPFADCSSSYSRTLSCCHADRSNARIHGHAPSTSAPKPSDQGALRRPSRSGNLSSGYASWRSDLCGQKGWGVAAHSGLCLGSFGLAEIVQKVGVCVCALAKMFGKTSQYMILSYAYLQ